MLRCSHIPGWTHLLYSQASEHNANMTGPEESRCPTLECSMGQRSRHCISTNRSYLNRRLIVGRRVTAYVRWPPRIVGLDLKYLFLISSPWQLQGVQPYIIEACNANVPWSTPSSLLNSYVHLGSRSIDVAFSGADYCDEDICRKEICLKGCAIHFSFLRIRQPTLYLLWECRMKVIKQSITLQGEGES